MSRRQAPRGSLHECEDRHLRHEWFKHAAVILRRVEDPAAGRLISCWDPQRLAGQGAWFSVREDDFRQGRGEIQYEGHIYLPVFEPEATDMPRSNKERFGDAWRTMLARRADHWPAIAGYGTDGKAREVLLYLDSILGPAPAQPDGETIMATPPPGIKWIGTPNFATGRNGLRPVAIVDHIMEGTLAACDSWFNNRESQVSAHFGVGKQGEIHQYVRTADTAWANGRCKRPDFSIEWLADAIRRGVNPNAITVSIEHEGKTGEAVPEAQYQATLALHRYLIAEYGIPIDRDHIVGHFKLDGVHRARCPGIGFPWDRLFADLGAPSVSSTDVSGGHAPKEVVKVPDGIRWVGSPHFAAEREGHEPVAIVFHTLDGTLAAAGAHYSDPNSQVSTHFAVGKQGEKYQFVRSVDTAWAAGVVNQPDLLISWLADAVGAGHNPNLLTVSLAFEGRSGDPLTEKQYAAGLELIRYLIDLYDIAIDKDHLIGHNRIDSVGQATCPGPAFPWDRLFTDLAPGPQEEPEITDVQALDEIWRIAGLIEGDHAAEADTLRRMVAALKE